MRRPDYYGFRTQRKRARRRSGWAGSMRVGALFAVLLGVNVYVFFFRGGTSIQDILKTNAINKQNKASVSGKGKRPAKQQASAAVARTEDDSIVIKGSLKGHLGLSSALAAHKVDGTQIAGIIEALRAKLNLRSLRPEHHFELRLDPGSGKLRKFIFHSSPVKSVVVSRTAGGELRARQQQRRLTLKVVKLGGKVTSSLNSAMAGAGEQAALVAKFVNLFSWDINWYADPRVGDQFRVIVEKRFLGDKFYDYGRVLAAEYRGAKGRYRVFQYRWRSGREGHYTQQGRSIKRAFLKMPLNFRRISSKYNKRRFHPVLHRTKGHFGVDYAAARGTPVWAAADGKVLIASRKGGAGKMVKLSHAGGIHTLYMHLNGFARGIKPGAKVKQRQVIGYVGSTGLATGPHLHYGIKRRGRHVDPLTFSVGQGPMLPVRERARFLDTLERRGPALAGIPTQADSAP